MTPADRRPILAAVPDRARSVLCAAFYEDVADGLAARPPGAWARLALPEDGGVGTRVVGLFLPAAADPATYPRLLARLRATVALLRRRYGIGVVAHPRPLPCGSTALTAPAPLRSARACGCSRWGLSRRERGHPPHTTSERLRIPP